MELREAIITKDIIQVKALIENGARVDCNYIEKCTWYTNSKKCLNIASEFNNPELVEILLKAGADVYSEKYFGFAPQLNVFQDIAFEALYSPTPEKYKILSLFIKYGADVYKTKFPTYNSNNNYSIVTYPIISKLSVLSENVFTYFKTLVEAGINVNTYFELKDQKKDKMKK